MRRRRPACDRRGLTLIEVVLTLTILAVAGALVSGALSTALRSWQSGLRAGREELIARIVLERIAVQLRAAVPARALLENKDAAAFDAGSGHVRFVTLAAGSAPIQVFYGLGDGDGGPRLVYREHPWPDKEFFAGGRPRVEEEVLEVTGFAVKVVKRAEEPAAGTGSVQRSGGSGTPGAAAAAGSVVEEPWKPGEWPARVELEIQVKAEGQAEPRVYAVAVPVLAQVAP